jgi:hypothetical protein
VRDSAFDLFKLLFEKGQGYEQALAAAVREIASKDDVVQLHALELFEILVEKRQGYEQAFAAAKQGLASEDRGFLYSVYDKAMKLLDQLKVVRTLPIEVEDAPKTFSTDDSGASDDDGDRPHYF